MKGIWAIMGLGVTALIPLITKTAFAQGAPGEVCTRLIDQLQAVGFTFAEALEIVGRIPGC